MNKDKLTSMCHKISDKTNLSFNEVIVYYFLESILKKHLKELLDIEKQSLTMTKLSLC